MGKFNLMAYRNRLLYTTARIEVVWKNGSTGSGTGVFFDFLMPSGRLLPALVTNKHVVENPITKEPAVSGRFHVHLTDHPGPKALPSGEVGVIGLNLFRERWVFHPDPNVDLCAMAIHPLRAATAQQAQHHLHWLPLGNEHIADEERLAQLEVGDGVYMVGYPIGLWDDKHNFPLIRYGNTASHPNIDFKGLPIGVVDIAAFPGSSGSPIMAMKSDGSMLLLGILSSGPAYAANGEIKAEHVPTAVVATSRTSIPVNLGFYVKSRELLKLGEQLMAATDKK